MFPIVFSIEEMDIDDREDDDDDDEDDADDDDDDEFDDIENESDHHEVYEPMSVGLSSFNTRGRKGRKPLKIEN